MFFASMANLLKKNELVEAFLKNNGIDLIIKTLKEHSNEL